MMDSDVVTKHIVNILKLDSPKYISKGVATTLQFQVVNLSGVDFTHDQVTYTLNMDSRLKAVGSLQPIGAMAPDEKCLIQVKVEVDQWCDLHDIVTWSVDLIYNNEKIYESQELSMIVIQEYIPPGQEDNFDVLFVTGDHLNMEEMQKYMKVFDGLGLTVNFWNIDLYNGLSFDKETGQRHFVTWVEYFRGRLIVFPVENNEMMELMSAEDAMRHVTLRFLGSGIVFVGADSAALKQYLLDGFAKIDDGTDKDAKKSLSDCKIFNVSGKGSTFLTEDIFVDLQTTEFNIQARMLQLIMTILSALSIERKLQLLTKGCFAVQQNWRVKDDTDYTVTNMIAFAMYKEFALQAKKKLPLTRMQNLVHLLSTQTESYCGIEVVKAVSEAMYRVKKDTFTAQWNMLSGFYKSVQQNVMLRNEAKRVLRGAAFDNALGKDNVNSAIKQMKSNSKKHCQLGDIKVERPLVEKDD